MMWLIYCAFYGLMLIQILRMLRQRGKWSWILFFGLIASAGAYVGFFVLPVAQAAALQEHKTLLAVILAVGTLLYAVAMIYFARKIGLKIKAPNG